MEQLQKDNQYGRFYLHSTEVWKPSKDDPTKGEYVMEDREYVEILTRGSHNTFSTVATDEHKKRWPNSYAEFKNEYVVEEGTSLNRLGFLGPSQIHALKAQGIMTVEHLAELDEQALNSINGSRKLQKQAEAYLAAMAVEDEPKKPKGKKS